ncbi:MAG: LssY C-terminal domain-containing protein [Bryobacteraceae bacterium]|nr:LssY C-terminal domain-containing protein [Bryobacteraceae bacterium]
MSRGRTQRISHSAAPRGQSGVASALRRGLTTTGIMLLSAVLAAAASSLSEMPARIRLETPLRSDALPPDPPFRATVAAPAVSGDRIWIPAGAVVHGVVRKARPVGLGLVRERAWMELDFREYELADGRRFPLSARLLDIDNAKEEVTAQGRIRGVVAAGHAHALVRGVWYQPSLSLPARSAAGLTGASGSVLSRFSMGPAGAAGLLALRFALVRLPEPEIDLPAGAELHIGVTALPEDAPWFEAADPDCEAEAAAARLRDLPFRIVKTNGKPVGDMIHLAVIGTREEVENAFRAAGWTTADPLTPSSFWRGYHAYTTMRPYPTLPLATLVYEGAPQELSFQKSLNTLAKRHHVRLWPAPNAPDGNLWLAAATHDISIIFDRRTRTITHKIDPEIDRERATVIEDLTLAGCAAPAGFAERPAAVHAPDGEIVTDGRLAALRLLPCPPAPDRETQASPRARKSVPARIVRRTALETRHYVVRGNVYYWAARGVAHAFKKKETSTSR